MDETRLTGTFPNMLVEITHRAAADGGAEHLAIQLTATPDFRSVLPLVAGFGQLPMAQAFLFPWTIWAHAAQSFLAPWSALTTANPFAPRISD